MTSNRVHKTAYGAVAVLSSFSAVAAPFCVVASYGKQCWYYDEPSCQRAAAIARGGCIVNQDEFAARPPAFGAPFCVVASYGTQCFYYDVPSCQQAARIAAGACVARDQ
jgi:hypothetical protein